MLRYKQKGNPKYTSLSLNHLINEINLFLRDNSYIFSNRVYCKLKIQIDYIF